MEELKTIIQKAGFTDLYIISDEVTDEYAQKWGYGLMIKEFIQRGLFIGTKIGEPYGVS